MSYDAGRNTCAPKISIITPAYNREKYLRYAAESVFDQTYDNWEWIIVDDGSTDGTFDLISEMSANDSRIKIFRQENRGQASARNVGLKASEGELISFLDSDNMLRPDKLKEAVEAFKNFPDADIVYADGILIDESGKEISRENMKRYSGKITKQLLVDNCVSMNTATVKRKCFDEMGGFNETKRVADDYELWLRFSYRYNFRYIQSYWSYYRVMEDQISSDKTRRFASNEETIRDFLNKYPDAVSPREAREALCHFYTRKARYHTTVRQWDAALTTLLKALIYKPLDPGPWRVLARVLTQRTSA